MTDATTSPRGPLISGGMRDMLLASLLFAVMGALVKLAEQHLPVGHAMFARSLIGLVISYWMVRRAGLSPRGNRPWLLGLRGLVGFAALLCTFHAIALLPLADASVILLTQPIWTAVAATFFLREHAGAKVWLGSALALGGVLLVAKPQALFGGGAEHLDVLGVVLALVAALLSAGAYVAVRALRRSDHPVIVVLWFALVATPASAPLVIAEPVVPAPWLWLVLLGIGLTVQGAQLLMTRALHREPAGRVAAVGYLQVVYGFIFGAALFGEAIEPLSIIGALVILGAAALVSIDWKPPAKRGCPNERETTLDSAERVG